MKMADGCTCVLFILLFLFVLIIFRTVCVLYGIHKNRNNVNRSNHRKLPAKMMIIVGSGGHTHEILRLQENLGNHYSPRIYVMADTDKMSEEKINRFELERKKEKRKSEYSIRKIPRSREVRQSYITSIGSTIYASLYSFPLVFTTMPDVVLTNGPGTCIPLCMAAFLMKVLCVKNVTVIYVESMCRVESLSLSAKILYYTADQLLVQWPQLQQMYPRTTYIGRLL